MDFSLRDHPIQGFQWGDYTAKPEHDYTYRVVAWGGTPGALTPLADVRVDVRTEAEDDGRHGIWFNRGRRRLAGVREAVRAVHPAGRGERGPPGVRLAVPRARARRSSGSPAAPTGPSGGCAARSTSSPGRPGWPRWPRPRAAGADVQLVVHGRDRDPAGKDSDTTAADNRAAVAAAGLDDVVTWRTAPNKSALQHNKFLVLTRAGAAGRGLDRLDEHHPGRGVRAPQRRPPDRRPGRGAAVPRLLGPARRPDRTRPRRCGLWTEPNNPVDLGAPPGVDHDPVAAGDDQPAAGLVRRRCSTARPRARTSPARSA